jgi:predicted ATPase with chaperone activity
MSQPTPCAGSATVRRRVNTARGALVRRRVRVRVRVRVRGALVRRTGMRKTVVLATQAARRSRQKMAATSIMDWWFAITT